MIGIYRKGLYPTKNKPKHFHCLLPTLQQNQIFHYLPITLNITRRSLFDQENLKSCRAHFPAGFTYDANHPLHLHGYAFRVVAMERLGSQVTREAVMERDRAGLVPRKLHRAPLKDTVTVPDGGYTAVRFHATNPGMGVRRGVGSNLGAANFSGFAVRSFCNK